MISFIAGHRSALGVEPICGLLPISRPPTMRSSPSGRTWVAHNNALAETINGPDKAEFIHRRGPWRNFEAVGFATLEWVDWFNNYHLLEPIGNIPPAPAEAQCYAVLDQPAMAASLQVEALRSWVRFSMQMALISEHKFKGDRETPLNNVVDPRFKPACNIRTYIA